MLPKSNDCPISGAQISEISLVSFSVRSQLQSPELRQFVFPRRQSPSVPKIAVNKDSNLFLAKDDVGCSMQFLVVPLKVQASFCELTLNQ
jgi:hypothetical protein